MNAISIDAARRDAAQSKRFSGHVIILAHGFPPENHVGALRPYYFAKYLGQYGYTTEVVAAPHPRALNEPINLRRVPEFGKDRPVVAWQAKAFAAAERYALPYHCEFGWTPHAVAAAREALIRNPGAALLSTSPPLTPHIAALWLKRRHSFRWIADCRDPIAGNPFHSSFRARHFDAYLQRRVIAGADAVIANTDTAREELVRRFPAAAGKIHLVWNGYDPADDISAAPIPARPFRVVAHFGSIYGGRHPGMLVEAAYRLIQAGRLDPERIRIRLIGSIELDQPWAATAAFSELRRRGCLEFNGSFVPRPEARAQMCRSEYLLLIDLNELATNLQVPAKLFEYIRIGRPILALTTPDSPVQRILARAGIPHVCIHPGERPEDMDEAVLSLLNMPLAATPPSPWFLSHFDAAGQTGELAGVLTALMGRGAQAGRGSD